MNILYIAEEISLPGYHGGSTHVQETLNSLKVLGHNVFAVCKLKKGQKEIEKIGKIEYHRVKLPETPIQKNIFLFANLENFLKKITDSKKIDLIWQRNRIFGNQGIILGKKIGVKTILEMNEPIETSENNILFPLIKAWFFHCVKFADIVTGTHECMFNKIPKEKRLLTWHGSNPKLFNPKRTDKSIVKKNNLKGKTLFYSGSFQKWHCLKNAFIAFKELQKKYPNAAFLLAGEGPQKAELEEFSKNEKIPNVHFLGNLPYEKLALYINASTVCIALFDREYPPIKKYDYYYSPIKVFDAMACGKPVIASGIGNLNKIIKKSQHGFLVNESSIKELNKSFENALTDRKVRKSALINNIKDARQKYNWLAITKRILGATKK